MKHILAILALVTASAFVSPTSAEAYDCGHQRVVGYTRCGRPIYSVYQVVGYDRCGHPIGRWVTQSSYCGCRTCNPPRYGSDCDHGHHHSSRRGGFYFSFGR
jgi:hypothetical protein